jgi:ketosteroid isomerase-like protein/muconolactone delta-isomerase
MLFYVQMKWNYQGRLTQDQLWAMEEQEGAHGMEGLCSGMVKGLYKVVSQHRIIAIVDADSLENLDRNSMGWLPMREYLEFEQVWALRDYPGFIADVQARFPLPGANQQVPSSAVAAGEITGTVSVAETRRVAEGWFGNLAAGNFDDALKLVDQDVIWENISPVPGVSDLAPWLGSYRGLPAVLDSFKVWAAHSRMLSMNLQELMVDGENAMGIVHEHAQCLANQNEYDLYVATQLKVRDGKIKKWKVYWDPSPLIHAYRNLQH